LPPICPAPTNAILLRAMIIPRSDVRLALCLGGRRFLPRRGEKTSRRMALPALRSYRE
jgi:hypothetical protein